MGASRPLKQTKSQTAASIWAQLASAQEPFPGARCIRDLPEPARRWLRHSVRTGRAIATSAQVEMDGDIRLGRWLRFRASQVVSPPRGFLWAAKARMGPFSITGYDRYADEIGEMRWRLGGLVPVMNAEGPDLTRSAAGRLAVDAVFVPTAFLGPSVTWKESTAPNQIDLSWAIGRFEIPVTMHIDASGALDRIAMKRWGNPSGEPWGEYAFGGYVGGEAEFDGIRIPTRLQAGWFFGTERWADGEFFRARIRSATFS